MKNKQKLLNQLCSFRRAGNKVLHLIKKKDKPLEKIMFDILEEIDKTIDKLDKEIFEQQRKNK